jgi:UDP-N-acetylglucosamine 2-epimerase (non-hydrolysing)
MHLNPNVRKPIREIFGEEAVSGTNGSERNIFFIEPPEYLLFVFLMEQSTPVLTESGGIREEAPRTGQTRTGNARHHRAS